MISVALLPPAAAAGIGIATANLKIASNATIILLINIVSINLAGTFTLWLQGYKPGKWYEQQGAKKATKSRILVLLVLLLVIAVFLGMMTWEVRKEGQRATRLREITREMTANAGAELSEFEVEKSGLFFQKIVGVSVEYRADESKENLFGKIDSELEGYLGRTLDTRLIYRRADTE
jgi:uncharacterized membrane protein